jgi:hypothetical protein
VRVHFVFQKLGIGGLAVDGCPHAVQPAVVGFDDSSWLSRNFLSLARVLRGLRRNKLGLIRPSVALPGGEFMFLVSHLPA